VTVAACSGNCFWLQILSDIGFSQSRCQRERVYRTISSRTGRVTQSWYVASAQKLYLCLQTFHHSQHPEAQFNLADNLLSGFIPAEIANYGALLNLTVSGNNFSGPIPPELGSVVTLGMYCADHRSSSCIALFADVMLNPIEELRIENNFLTGAIPIELVGLGDLGKSNGQKLPNRPLQTLSWCLPL
jgi:hypothetical protein